MGEEEEIEGAIATDNDNDGKYPNNACQKWKIMTKPSKVKLLFFGSEQPSLVTILLILCFNPLHIVSK